MTHGANLIQKRKEIGSAMNAWNRLTKKGREDCFKLMSGATPADLGLGMAEAAVLLATVSASITEGLERSGDELDFDERQELTEYRDRLRRLARLMWEADPSVARMSH